MTEISKTKKTKASPDISDLLTYLETIETTVPPSVHINGGQYSNCVMTVDFGQPLNPTKLTNEQQGELGSRLKKATRVVMGKEVNVRVSSDPATGIWWTTSTNTTTTVATPVETV